MYIHYQPQNKTKNCSITDGTTVRMGGVFCALIRDLRSVYNLGIDPLPPFDPWKQRWSIGIRG